MLARRAYGWLGTFQAMASPCEVHVASPEQALAERVFDAVVGETQRIEAKFSRYKSDNIIARINSANGTAVEVDDETARLLDYAAELHRLSDGRFDITSGVLRRVWHFDGSDRLPSAAAVKEVLRYVGWHRVDWSGNTLRLAPGMEIDFGGIGKEFAVDRAAAIARELAPRCMINFGGDLVAVGSVVDNTSWTVGIEDPSQADRPVAQIKLTRGALATSGDARRYLLKDGKRYGHILDPRTGWPVENAPRSVTVTAPTCTHAGMLATFAMLEGAEAEAFLDGEDVRYWCLR